MLSTSLQTRGRKQLVLNVGLLFKFVSIESNL